MYIVCGCGCVGVSVQINTHFSSKVLREERKKDSQSLYFTTNSLHKYAK